MGSTIFDPSMCTIYHGVFASGLIFASLLGFPSQADIVTSLADLSSSFRLGFSHDLFSLHSIGYRRSNS